jgi:hypothetical protein
LVHQWGGLCRTRGLCMCVIRSGQTVAQCNENRPMHRAERQGGHRKGKLMLRRDMKRTAMEEVSARERAGRHRLGIDLSTLPFRSSSTPRFQHTAITAVPPSVPSSISDPFHPPRLRSSDSVPRRIHLEMQSQHPLVNSQEISWRHH